jgi:hypothetical protein
MMIIVIFARLRICCLWWVDYRDRGDEYQNDGVIGDEILDERVRVGGLMILWLLVLASLLMGCHQEGFFFGRRYDYLHEVLMSMMIFL